MLVLSKMESGQNVPMRQSAVEREANLNVLRKKISDLENLKKDMLHKSRIELTHLERIHKELESKGRLVLREQEERICKAKEAQNEKLQRVRGEVDKVKEAITVSQRVLNKKEESLSRLRQKHTDKMKDMTKEEAEIRAQIEEENRKIAGLDEERKALQEHFSTEVEDRRQRFQAAKDDVEGKIADLEKNFSAKKDLYEVELVKLNDQLEEVEKSIKAKANEGKEELSRLMIEKEGYKAQLKEAEDRLAEVRIREEEQVAKILSDHHKRYIEMEKSFESQANPLLAESERLQKEIATREADFEKLRDEKDQEYQEAAKEASEKIQAAHDELHQAKAASKVKQKEKEDELKKQLLEMDDSVLKKQQQLNHMENDYRTEEAMLRLKLDTLKQHIASLSGEGPQRKKMYSDRIQALEQELSKTKAAADQEHEKYLVLKRGMEEQLDSKREKVQAQALAASRNLNELDNKIMNLKQELRDKHELLKNIDSKAQEKLEGMQDELLRQKDANVRKVSLLKDTFDELSKRLENQRKEKAEIIKGLEAELLEQRKIQEQDIKNLQNLVVLQRKQAEKVKSNLEEELGEIAQGDEKAEEQSEKPLLKLQLNLIDKLGGESQDFENIGDLASKVEELEELYSKRKRELATALKGQDARASNEGILEDLEQQIREKFEKLSDDEKKFFEEGGPGHKLFLEKTKNDELVEEYKRQVRALAEEKQQSRPSKQRASSKKQTSLTNSSDHKSSERISRD